ncbi:MAG: hypothetical protein V3W41_10600 [Planctomycetota bacterium]
MKMCGSKVKSVLTQKIDKVESVEIDVAAGTARVTVGKGGKISGDDCVAALSETRYEVKGITAAKP